MRRKHFKSKAFFIYEQFSYAYLYSCINSEHFFPDLMKDAPGDDDLDDGLSFWLVLAVVWPGDDVIVSL